MFTCLNYLLDNGFLELIFKLENSLKISGLLSVTFIKKLNFQAPFYQGVSRWLHLYQEWNMFAPFPKMDNIWVEIPAVLSDGSDIELLTGDRDIYSIKAEKFYKIIPTFFYDFSEVSLKNSPYLFNRI